MCEHHKTYKQLIEKEIDKINALLDPYQAINATIEPDYSSGLLSHMTIDPDTGEQSEDIFLATIRIDRMYDHIMWMRYGMELIKGVTHENKRSN